MLIIDNDSHVIEAYSDNSWGAPRELSHRALLNPADLEEVQDNSCQLPIAAPASGGLAVQEFLRD